MSNVIIWTAVTAYFLAQTEAVLLRPVKVLWLLPWNRNTGQWLLSAAQYSDYNNNNSIDKDTRNDEQNAAAKIWYSKVKLFVIKSLEAKIPRVPSDCNSNTYSDSFNQILSAEECLQLLSKRKFLNLVTYLNFLSENYPKSTSDCMNFNYYSKTLLLSKSACLAALDGLENYAISHRRKVFQKGQFWCL